MRQESIKDELVNWVNRISDKTTLNYLKMMKDATDNNTAWWYDVEDDIKAGIERGLNDIDAGRITPHDEVKRKSGL